MQKLNSESDKTFLPTISNIRSSNRNSTSEYENLPLNSIFCQQTKPVKGKETKKGLRSDSHLSKNIGLFFQNDEKCFLFHLKSSFCSQDI